MTMHTSAPSFHPFRGNSFTCALLASPYPRHPALCRQDTTFTWRLDGAVTTLMFVISFSLSSVFPPRSTDPIQFPTFRRHFECTGRSRNHSTILWVRKDNRAMLYTASHSLEEAPQLQTTAATTQHMLQTWQRYFTPAITNEHHLICISILIKANTKTIYWKIEKTIFQ